MIDHRILMIGHRSMITVFDKTKILPLPADDDLTENQSQRLSFLLNVPYWYGILSFIELRTNSSSDIAYEAKNLAWQSRLLQKTKGLR